MPSVVIPIAGHRQGTYVLLEAALPQRPPPNIGVLLLHPNTLRAAAGGLGEEMESAVEDWVRAPEGMRLGPDIFAAHVVGSSMEPRIPDGSLNLFRLHPAGSRGGKFLLIERFGVLDNNARYTV